MNWRREADGMRIEQAGAGTLSVLTLTNEVAEWEVEAGDGIGWIKQDDGSLDVFFRHSLMVAGGEFEIVGSFAQGGWQYVRWEAADGSSESEGRP